jgi:brefeldin A-resistance guanine nucleotide exchange factor 1
MPSPGANMLQDTASSYNDRSSRPITVAVDPVALVVTECVTVTSAMRKHPRWAQSSISAILGGPASTTTPSLRQSDQSSRPTTAGSDIGGKAQVGARRKTSQEIAAPSRLSEDGGLASRLLRGRRGQGQVVQDNPLLSAFGRLRVQLKHCRGMYKWKQDSWVSRWKLSHSS